LRPHAAFAQGLVITSLPRGGLHITQPLNVSESVMKSYAETLHTEDHLTWRAMVSGEPMRLSDVFTDDAAERNAYVKSVLAPMGVKYALSIPLSGPVLDGYPGAVHLLRTADQGDFSNEDVQALQQAVRVFEVDLAQSRAGNRGAAVSDRHIARPPVSLAVLNSDLKPLTPGDSWTEVDDGLRAQMVEQARQQFGALNGQESTLDRVNIPDSHGDRWVFNRVVYKKYPALGDGPVTFFCLQPDCSDWSTVKASDLQADPELSRLMPAVKFMHTEYSRGPTLTEIAQQVKLSPFHFHRRFTELLGMTPKQYMLACQIHQAKTDLLAGQKELATIAKECGFAHQSHFTSRFKQATGLTPTRWRRMALRRVPQPANN
jgi:AraC-like DNA-binding protein